MRRVVGLLVRISLLSYKPSVGIGVLMLYTWDEAFGYSAGYAGKLYVQSLGGRQNTD